MYSIVEQNSQDSDSISDSVEEVIALVAAGQGSDFLQKLYRELNKEEFRLVVLGMGCKPFLLKPQRKIVQHNFTCLN